MNGSDDPSTFRRYLLGELGEPEQEALEKELMTSEEQFQELLIAEDELVDDYCAGRLSPSEEQEYRDRFLITPERRYQHRFGAALLRVVSARAAPKATGALGGWRLLLVAAAAALLAVGLWRILTIERPPVRLEQTATRVEDTRVSFFLTGGGLRSLEPEAMQTLGVPAGVALVELQLDLPAGAGGDQEVTLEDARGAILAKGTLPAQTIEGESVVVAAVPAEILVSGEYRAIVRSLSAVVATYPFRVSR